VPVGVPPLEVTVKVTAIPWPTTEGLGVWPVIVVVVLAALTVWLTPTEALAAKFASPAYVAVTERPPAELNAILQLPTATLALQLWVPSLTVTVPVGVPLPGAFATTVNVKLAPWPTADGSGVSPVIVVAVLAEFTVWGTPAEVLPAKFASPPYVAVSVLAPAVVGVSVQSPAATVPTQLTVPSLTVTLPVGVPPLEVTVNVTAIPWPTTEGLGV
jgi:hypothetical protein